jgi:hypothetical protein
MRKTLIRTLCFAGLLLLLAGCAGMPVSQRESSVKNLLYELQQRDPQGAARLTHIPFLFDTEVLTTERDAELMWTNLQDASGFLSQAELLGIAPATPAEYTRFADTAEVRVFFANSLPENPAFAEISTPYGRFLLLLSGKNIGYPIVVGVKGPMQ